MIRVLIADDHAILRGGLKQIIASTADLIVADEATTGEETLDKARSGEIDLALLDMNMPGLHGIDLIRRLRTENPALPVLILSMYNEGQVASRALRAGAAGYVAKDSDPEVLLTGMRKVAAGGQFIDPALVNAIVFESLSIDAPPHDVLSDREFQVLQLLASGKSINDIGTALNLSAKTISTHKMRLMEKLALTNNADLFRYAIKHGLAQQ